MNFRKILFCVCIFLLISPVFSQDENYEEWYLRRDDTRIYVRELLSKSTDTVIVVHGGFGANHDYLLDSVKGLENKFHFVFYDQRGSLLSPTDKENLTFSKNVEDLFALFKQLNRKKVKLLCHSMGTLVCMEYLSLYPETVSNIVLVGAILPKVESANYVFSERVSKQTEFLQNRGLIKKLKSPYNEKKDSLSDKEKTESWRIDFASVNIYKSDRWRLMKGGQIYYNGEASIISKTVEWNYDYRKIMNDHRKVTIINGEYDFLDFNGEEYRKLIKDFPNIIFKLIPNAGHNIWIDDKIGFRSNLQAALIK